MFVSLFFIIISTSSDQKTKKYIYKGDKPSYYSQWCSTLCLEATAQHLESRIQH